MLFAACWKRVNTWVLSLERNFHSVEADLHPAQEQVADQHEYSAGLSSRMEGLDASCKKPWKNAWTLWLQGRQLLKKKKYPRVHSRSQWIVCDRA